MFAFQSELLAVFGLMTKLCWLTVVVAPSVLEHCLQFADVLI